MKSLLQKICMIAVMGACSFGVYQNRNFFEPSDLDRLAGTSGVIIYKQPVQKLIDNNLYTFEDSSVPLVPVAVFDISGVVLSKKRYMPWSDKSFAPWDIALGWGSMSDPSKLSHVDFWSAGRELHFNFAHNSPVQKPEILAGSANIHIIPANDEMHALLSGIQSGDIVRLTGFLVNAVDGLDVWQTSTLRNDTGKGSGEILYVENVDLNPL